jgi:outer membrane lipoprotein-sorting protein
MLNKNLPKLDVLSDYMSYLESLDAKIIGNETVDKYDCDIYEFTDPRFDDATSKVWLWRNKRFPVKVETSVPGGIITTIMKDVQIGIDIDDSEFILPPGVKIREVQGIIE